MVRKSALIYDLLRSERREDGFSPNEILKRVSEIHSIAPGKGLKKQINVALRRGIDFGILVRRKNKYIYDSNDPSYLMEQSVEQKMKKRKKVVKKRKKSSSSSKSRRRRAPPSSRKQSRDSPPRLRVPPPPNWTPKRRNIREEPIPKFIKHPHNSPRLL